MPRAIRRAPSHWYWKSGVTHCGLVVSPSQWLAPTEPMAPRVRVLGRVIVVTNNGVVWSARSFEWDAWTSHASVLMFERVRAVLGTPVPKEIKRGALVSAEPEWRLPMEWAKKAAKEHGKDYVVEAAKTASSVTMPRAGGGREIEYTGFERYAKRSAHSLARIHAVVDAAADLCETTWGWNCDGLEVKFHDTSNSYGVAYEPGSGAELGVRKISLNVKLIEAYDETSIGRTVLHELAHHYREERWPRDRYFLTRWSHDSVFCRELRRVDPLVTSNAECEGFTDERDVSIVAAMGSKGKPKKEPVWSPTAGVVVFDRYASGKYRVTWRPDAALGFSWPKHVTVVNDALMLELARRFAPAEWGSVRVEAPDWVMGGPAPTSLRQLLVSYVTAWPSPKFSGKLSQYMRDVAAAVQP